MFNSRSALNFRERKNSGCYVSIARAFVLLLIAMAIATGVGVIVHFAGARTKAQPCRLTSVNNRSEPTNAPDTWELCKKICRKRISTLSWLVTTTAVEKSTPRPKAEEDSRLPKSLIPLYYDIELKPNIYGPSPKLFNFDGYVSILIRCVTATRAVTIHAKHLNVVRSSAQIALHGGKGSAPNITSYDEDEKREFIIFHLDGKLLPGSNYSIHMNYTGPINTHPNGLYAFSYKNENHTVYIASSQFEPMGARMAFPCFDEPHLKARFKVTLVRKSHMKSLSNMQILKTYNRPGDLKADVYAVTLKMSTYLLAFIVCDFHFKQNTTKRGIQIRVWARPDATDEINYALDSGMKALDLYSSLLGIPFPLKKLDMIALARMNSAMENWGLITYAERFLLYEDGLYPAANKELVTEVICHEIAHQWFGNLVTMSWWKDIWLNEGFASFMQYVCMDHLHPTWRTQEESVYKDMQYIFTLDAQLSSHPIYFHTLKLNYFDRITYKKGSCIIRMMRFALGEKTFWDGLSRYLKHKEYGNADHDDLWSILTQQSKDDGKNVDVKKFMDTWILQMNYPVVTLEWAKEGKELRVFQQRFLLNKNGKQRDDRTSPFGYSWRIPLTFTTKEERNFSQTSENVEWLRGDEDTVIIRLSSAQKSPDNWIIGNIGQYGYYRTNYDRSNWRRLIEQLNDEDHTVIPPINRAQLINDAWTFAAVQFLDQDIAIELIQYLHKERDYLPWLSALTEMNIVRNRLTRTSRYGDFQADKNTGSVPKNGGFFCTMSIVEHEPGDTWEEFMREKLGPIYNHLGWNDAGSSLPQTLLRSQIIEAACTYSLRECVAEALRLFDLWRRNPLQNRVDPNLQGVVYCTGVRLRDFAAWTFVSDRCDRPAAIPAERNSLCAALACSREPWILSRLLENSRDAQPVILDALFNNAVGRGLVWQFTVEKLNYFFRRYGSIFVRALSKSVSSAEELEKLNILVSINSTSGDSTKYLEEAMRNTLWMKNNYPIIEKWLVNRTHSVSKKVEKKLDVRLPRSLTPYLYDIELTPEIYGENSSRFCFHGYVKMHFTCEESTSNITFHAHKLNINTSSVHLESLNASGTTPTVASFQEDALQQIFIVKLDGELKEGNMYIICINFTGPLTNDLVGFYLSSYKQGNSTTYMATTKFEKTYARRAFPCFDEPQLKARFNVILVRKPHYISISNMEIINTYNRSNGYIADVYNTTLKMSTYLLAFIVCGYKKTENTTKSGTLVQVWARKEFLSQGSYALQKAIDVLEYFEDYFQIKYPLSKEGLISIPNFGSKAMENWGLVTFREGYLLYNPKDSERCKLNIARVLAHELAHQWFGNLVTLCWWDDLWLNEGFATYLESMAVNHIEPTWNYSEVYVTSQLHRVFETDDVQNSQPVYSPGTIKHDVTIVYLKGAVIIRMMRIFLGDDILKAGLRHYLINNAYGSVTHNDLWNALSEEATSKNLTINVGQIMDTWISQNNYPVVSISINGTNLVVKQERFLMSTHSGSDSDEQIQSDYGYKWEIPFTFTTSRERNFNKGYNDVNWIHVNQTTATMKSPISPDDKDGWIIGNPLQYGVYRVNYDKDNWKALIKQLKNNHTIIPTINRAQIVNDAWNLAKSGRLSKTIALETLEYLNNEEEYLPWKTVLHELLYIQKMLERTELYGELMKFMVSKVNPIYNKLRWNNSHSTPTESLLRLIITRQACMFHIPECVNKAKNDFKQWKESVKKTLPNPIHPDFQNMTYCTALENGDYEDWEFVFDEYKQTNFSDRSLLFALPCTRETWLLRRFLQLLDTPEMRKDFNSLISVAANPVGLPLAWDFLRSKWQLFIEKPWFSWAINSVSSHFNTEFELKELQDFIDEISGRETNTNLRIHYTERNVKWMKENYGVIGEWLKKVNNP